MIWVDKELGDVGVWWVDKTTRISEIQKYELFSGFMDYWKQLVDTLEKIYGERFHPRYVGKLIHDGNVVRSSFISILSNMGKGKPYSADGGWYTSQQMLGCFRQAEILIALYNTIKDKNVKKENG